MARRLPESGQRLAEIQEVSMPPDPPAPAHRHPPREFVRQERAAELELMTPFEVDAEAWRLSVIGWSPWRINAALGFDDYGMYRAALNRYMDSEALEQDQKVGIMVGQLDAAIEQVIGVSRRDHFRFTAKGEMIMMRSDLDNPSSELVPVVDDKPILDAARVLAVLLERKAKLLGLDQPSKHEHTLTPLPPVAARWVESKRLELGE